MIEHKNIFKHAKFSIKFVCYAFTISALGFTGSYAKK